MKIYSIWSDPAFYAAAAVFAFGMFFLVFSIRKYLEVKNKSGFEEPGDENGEIEQGELPLESADASGQPSFQLPGASAGVDAPGAPIGVASGAQDCAPLPSSKAEEFVKGLYDSLASLDGRLKNIETTFSKMNVNKDFTVTFLEDIISDFDALDKEKIKARIEYLVSDLKK